MKRAWTIAGVAGAAATATPALAYAQDDTIPASVFYPHIGVSLIGLLVAGLLLTQVVGFRKLALGGAIAEKINYVILAILCLAASALTEWAVNFAGSGITIAQAQLAREVLVIIAMALLAVYYYSVRAAMNAYLRAMTADMPPASGSESEHDRG